jgi:hypothetical protein
MRHWIHVLLLVTTGVLILFAAVLISAFGWGILVFATVIALLGWLFARWIARHRHHRYPNL